MSELSKQALKVDNNQSFPNNNTGYITPSRLRDFNVNMIDSLVDEQTFNSFSQSVTASIEALENFSSSLSTAYASEADFTAFTASTNTKINNLSAQTASYATSAITASSLVTASFNNGTRNLTFTKGDATTFNVNIPDVSGSAGNFVTTSSFNSYTASTDSSISQLNASTASQQVSINALNTNSASVNTSIINVNSATASLFTSVNNINTFTQSAQTSINALNAATSSYVTSAITASSLVTASLSGNTITFTKGDSSTFGFTIPDVSGSTINTGSLVSTASFNAYTQSNDQRVSSLEANSGSVNTSITNINSATSSLFTSASLGLTTASFAAGTLTFTKGNGTTFGVTIPDVSGSAGTTIFEVVYTGENITKGDPLYISGSQGANPIVYKADASNPAKMPVTFVSNETIGASNTTNAIVLGLIEGIDLTGYTAGQSIYVAEGGGWSTSLPSGSNSVTQLLGVVTKGGSGGKGLVLNPGPAQLPGLDSGYLWAGDVNNQPTQVTTASFATTGSNTFVGTQVITAAGGLNINAAGPGASTFSMSGSQNSITFTAPNTFMQASAYFNLNNNYTNGGSGSLEFTAVSASIGVYPTNGLVLGHANVVGGVNTNGFVRMNTLSGSLVLAPSGFTNTLSSLSHLSSSSNTNNVNLIFKNSNTAADTIISGSGNIFTNPSAATAGFKRYLTGANIAIGGSGVAVPQISGSMAFSPTIANNYFGVSATPLTIRGPVSSSAYLINNNVLAGGNITLGTAAATNYERAINGTNVSGNIINGNIGIAAYKTAFISASAMTIANNNLGGQTTINADSSSITLAGSTIQNASLTVNNSYYNVSATGGGNAFQISAGNAIFGNSTTIYASGSNTNAATPRQFTANIVAGTFNSASLNLNGDNSNIQAIAIIGHGLNVTGSSALQTGAPARTNSYGSAFFGRFNAEDGNRARTAETVFAVGTGNTTTSKTGFLIDSGSNTFVEGTLNVSGSTSMTGSLNVSGSINVISGSLTSQAITNVTPVSSSLSPILNMVTMTSAEYALITPNSQTLYIIV